MKIEVHILKRRKPSHVQAVCLAHDSIDKCFVKWEGRLM